MIIVLTCIVIFLCVAAYHVIQGLNDILNIMTIHFEHQKSVGRSLEYIEEQQRLHQQQTQAALDVLHDAITIDKE